MFTSFAFFGGAEELKKFFINNRIENLQNYMKMQPMDEIRELSWKYLPLSNYQNPHQQNGLYLLNISTTLKIGKEKIQSYNLLVFR